MQIPTKIFILVFMVATVLMPYESRAGWGEGDRNVDSCSSDSDYRSVISIGSNIDICIATSNWIQKVENEGTAAIGDRLQDRLETALSTFCGGLAKVESGQTSTGGGSREKNGRHYMWVTASVVCTWM